jgi:hypothetical protein
MSTVISMAGQLVLQCTTHSFPEHVTLSGVDNDVLKASCAKFCAARMLKL